MNVNKCQLFARFDLSPKPWQRYHPEAPPLSAAPTASRMPRSVAGGLAQPEKFSVAEGRLQLLKDFILRPLLEASMQGRGNGDDVDHLLSVGIGFIGNRLDLEQELLIIFVHLFSPKISPCQS